MVIKKKLIILKDTLLRLLSVRAVFKFWRHIQILDCKIGVMTEHVSKPTGIAAAIAAIMTVMTAVCASGLFK